MRAKAGILYRAANGFTARSARPSLRLQTITKGGFPTQAWLRFRRAGYLFGNLAVEFRLQMHVI